MFDIGFSEMVLLAAIALVAIGPKQLPEVARVVGRMLNEFKRAAGDFTRTIVETRDTTNRFVNDTQKSVLDTVMKRPEAAKGPTPSTAATSPQQTSHASSTATWPLSPDPSTHPPLPSHEPAPDLAPESTPALDAHQQMSFEIDSLKSANTTNIDQTTQTGKA